MSMQPAALAYEVEQSHAFFKRATAPFTEQDSGFAPYPDMFSVAQQIAHVARTVDWFAEAGQRAEGFDHDFERHVAEARAVTSISEARAWIDRACLACAQWLREADPAWLAAPLPEAPVMGGAPRAAIVGGIVDHTAHHRGVLSVYLRALGQRPPMPYMDEDAPA